MQIATPLCQLLGTPRVACVAMSDVVVSDINGNDEDSRQIHTLLIDLDDTLYQVHEAPELVRENIQGVAAFDISVL